MHGCRTTCWNMGSLSEAPSLKKANSSSSRSYLLPTAPQLGGETSWAPPNAVIPCRFYACSKFTVTVRSWVPWCDHGLETAILWKCPLPLALLALRAPLPWYSLALLQEGGYGCLTQGRASHTLLLPELDQLWISVLVTTYGKKKCLWWGWRDALIYRS